MLSLRNSMRATYAVILAGFVVLGYLAIDRLQAVSAQSAIMSTLWLPKARAAGSIADAARTYRISEALRILTSSPEMSQHADEDIRTNAGLIEDRIAQYRKLLQAGEDSTRIDAVESLWRKYELANRSMLADARTNQQTEATNRFRNSASRFYLLATALDDLSQNDADHSMAASATADRLYKAARWQTAGAVALIALLLAGVVLFYEVRVWQALLGLSGKMQRIAADSFDAKISETARNDEIGEMARAVQIFKDNSIAKKCLESDTARQREVVEAQRLAAESERQKNESERSQVVAAVALGLEKLSGGVLSFRLTEKVAPEFQKLQDDFNLALDKLQAAMKVIAAGAEGIHSGTAEISEASDQLARRTENQAASLEETAAALEQLTVAVRASADGAMLAKGAVAATKMDTEKSSDVVNRAVAAMGQIEGSSRQISDIVSVMDEIAFQTNLLALNAGVEAARAGDAGRGFAVVASEVRALAQRSTVAAKEIKSLISSSNNYVNAGVGLVADAGLALERIALQVAQINDSVGEIAAAAAEQAAGLVQVNASIAQMDKVTQQNAAMAEESTAASHRLAHEADELAKLIGEFELDATQKATRVAASPKAAVRVERPRTDTILRALGTGRNATARKLESAIEESWEEF